MMSSPRSKLMRADGAAAAAGRTPYDRRPLIVRLERIDLGPRAGLTRRPFPVKRSLVNIGIESGQEFLVVLNSFLDEVPRGRFEHRTALLAIGIQQPIAGPALQCAGEFPAKVRRV